ncbi:MAG: EAL domain-containing protein [Gammaproteobacteria bacterium]|nr:EAL domain-containing protein [Gammaproteobacteria bacterium]
MSILSTFVKIFANLGNYSLLSRNTIAQGQPSVAMLAQTAAVAIEQCNLRDVAAIAIEREQANEAMQRSELRYRRLFESARDGILILDKDDRKIADANPYMTELLGYTHDEFLGKELWEIGLLKDENASAAAFQELQENGYMRYEDLPLQTKDRQRREVEFISNVYGERNQQVIQCNIRDITERKDSQEKIRQRDELLQGIFDSVSSEIVVVDANGIITHVSNSWERFALENGALVEPVGIGMNYLDVCPRGIAEDPSANRTSEGIRAVMEGKQPDFDIEYPCHLPAGQRWFKMQVDPRPPEVGGAVITHSDITERTLAGERIAHEALHDALTGLPNRSLFVEHLHQAIAYAKRHDNYLFAVLFLDLDRFKVINDSLGHIAGDQFLVRIARKLESVVRPEDAIARIGGDEFTILLNDINSIRDATRVANRINKEFSQPFPLAEQQVFTTASVGITLSKRDYTSTEEVLRDADTAMYRAKSRGGGRYEVFDPSMQASVMALLKLESDLRRAIEREEFCLHYQPIISLENNRNTGFEALVRWRHPERGLVFPDEFIPVAEENGLIMPIGNWVLHEACRQVREWQDSSRHNASLSVSVNLSSREFSQPGLVEQVSRVLEQTGLPARSLELEITESSMMEKSHTVSALLGELKGLGVKLQIDDFGTGYSSLSNLHNFPVDVLKIDRSFVMRMAPGNKSSEIVQTIVQLAHILGMEVTAEGVETAEQLAQLRALRCEYGQGYHFSKPVDGEAAKRMIVH